MMFQTQKTFATSAYKVIYGEKGSIAHPAPKHQHEVLILHNENQCLTYCRIKPMICRFACAWFELCKCPL